VTVRKGPPSVLADLQAEILGPSVHDSSMGTSEPASKEPTSELVASSAASANRTAGRPRSIRRTLIVIAVGLSAATVAGVVGWLAIPGVTIEEESFQWSTPPSELCDGYTTSGPNPPTSSEVPVTVDHGAQFNVSMEFGCFPSAGNGTWTFERAESVTFGFKIVGSNMPVTFTTPNLAFVNVTLSAPPWHFVGAVNVVLLVQAG